MDNTISERAIFETFTKVSFRKIAKFEVMDFRLQSGYEYLKSGLSALFLNTFIVM